MLRKLSPKIIYIAGPYTSVDPLESSHRERQLTQAAVIVAWHGHIVYSPITHSAPLERLGLHLSHEEWMEFDRPFLELATHMLVVRLAGYDKSRRVQWEIETFSAEGKPPIAVLSLDCVEDWARGLNEIKKAG